jgi:hypothetical protein
MLVTVLAVLAFAAFRAVTRDNEPTPVRAVDYVAVARMARADKQLLVVTPEKLPTGWSATSATYTTGAAPAWHLGMLTNDGKYVGVEESQSTVQDLAREHVDVDAQRGKDVTIAGQTWQTWTDTGGDYAVTRSLRSGGAGGTGAESLLVVGTAPEQEIRDLAATLTGGRRPAG